MLSTNITGLDYVIIAVYMIFLISIGVYFSRKVKSSEDYYLAGRSLPFIVIMATVCASIVGGGAMIGRGGVTYSKGAVSLMLGIPYLIGMFVFSGFSGRIQVIGKKHNISSIPDLMEFRFGSTVRYLSAVLIAFTMMATVGSQITGTAIVLKTFGADWGITYEMGACIALFIVLIYTTCSGLFGVVYTDVVQFFVLLLAVYLVLPFIAVGEVGGIGTLLEKIPGEMLSIKPDSQIIGWIFTNLVFTMAGAEMWQRAFAARSKGDASKGMYLGTFVYAITIVITLIVGLCGFILLPNLVESYGSADAVVPAMVIHYLPAGMTGLGIAGMLAALMSTADTYLLMATQTIVNDIIKKRHPNIKMEKELLLARVFTVSLGLLALVIAFKIRAAYNALMFAWTFYAASLGIPAFVALFWKKATKEGIVAGILAGFIISIVWKFMGEPGGLGSAIPGSLASLVCLLIVTYLTYKKEEPSPFPEYSS